MILDTIVEKTKRDIEKRRARTPVVVLEERPFFGAQIVSLKEYLCRPGSSGVIAELKRASPSAGDFHEHLDIESVSIGYMQAGAAALSVLTEPHYFKGSLKDIEVARRFNFCPILRKDFIVDEYQLYEARAAGADVVLLIRRILSNEALELLSSKAHALGLEVLLEVHDADECKGLDWSGIDVLGINNRNLDTLVTDVQTTFSIRPQVPEDVVVISESGISSAEVMRDLAAAGCNGFLIGEAFLKHARPHEHCRRLIEDYVRLSKDHACS